MENSTYLIDLGFEQIGMYVFDNNQIDVKYKVKKTERVSLVYALLVDDNIFYLGKTVQGFNRPLNYHKNNVMINVKNGITKHVSEGKHVKIFTKKFMEEDMMGWKGLKLNIFEAVEQALILKFRPEWNKYSHK